MKQLQDISETFLNYFNEIEDPRLNRKKLYSSHEILLITICAIICGAESWRDLVIFGKAKLEFLRTYLPLSNGIPSKNTFCRFFAALKPDSFKECFIAWVQSLRLLDNDVIAIDGKTLRGSFDKANNKSAIHMVSAYCC